MGADAPTDDELTRRVTRGDERAFRTLVERHATALHRLVARLVGESDADDVTQETFTKAFVALRSGRYARREKLAAWLRRIAVRTALDALRSRRRRRLREEHVGAQTTPEVGTARVALRELDMVLAGLPAPQRTALVLKQIEGWSTKEIAKAMGCSVGAVEQRLVRARAALREARDE